MEGLRTWRIKGFPLIWFYFERADHLDVVRLLGERQDVVALLMQSS
jgi:toxin ParE1/3/4